MTQVDFYHLTQSGHDAALTMLLKKTLAVGKKALILCPKPAANVLDNALWADEADSWIAHGVDDAAGSDVAPFGFLPTRASIRMTRPLHSCYMDRNQKAGMVLNASSTFLMAVLRHR